MSRRIFISYRRDDTSWVTTSIYQSLLKHFPKEQIFRDIDSIPFGVDFLKLIEEQVSRCDVLVAVIGKDWLKLTDVTNTLESSADFVRVELATAFKRNVRVIPVVIDDAKMPKAYELPGEINALSRINAVPVSNMRFSADINQLVLVLREVLKEKKMEVEEVVIEEKPPRGRSTFLRTPAGMLLLLTGIAVLSPFAGTVISALVAVMVEASSNKKIELDTSMGWTMFWICTVLSFLAMAFFAFRKRKKQ